MANINETNQGHEYRVTVSGEELVFKIYDGEGKGAGIIENLNPAANMADRVMEESGDSLPLEIIEGGKTEETVNDRKVRIISPLIPKGIFYVVWEMIAPEKPVNSGMSLFDRIKKIF